jgi:hypothetical protein
MITLLATLQKLQIALSCLGQQHSLLWNTFFFHANEESRFAPMTAKCYMEANPHQFVDEINLRRNVS